MIKFNGLDLKDMKITDALASVLNGKKIAVGSEIIWEKNVSPLPSGYRQVEWLQGQGGQYIQTLLQPTNNSYYMIDFIYSQVGNLNQGGRTSPFAGAFGYYRGARNLQGKFGNTTTSNVSINGNVRYIIEQSQDGFFVNSEKQYSYNAQTFNTGCYFVLFALNTNGTISNYSTDKICECILKNNNEDVQHLIPCLDPNDRPCMFDLVTQQPFYNQGTGEFLYGNII